MVHTIRTMPSRHRLSPILKWMSTLICGALVWAWILSAERVFIVDGPGGASAAVTGGQLCLTIDTPPLPEIEQPKTGVQDYYSEYRWWFEVVWRTSVKAFYIPLWFIVAVFAGIICFGWRAEHKARRARMHGGCPACGYDRRGLDSISNCPECGSSATVR